MGSTQETKKKINQKKNKTKKDIVSFSMKLWVHACNNYETIGTTKAKTKTIKII